MQVSFAITTAAKSVSSEGSQRKRPRTDNEGDAEAQSQQASKLFVEKPSPVALAKAIKNTVCSSAICFQFRGIHAGPRLSLYSKLVMVILTFTPFAYHWRHKTPVAAHAYLELC